MSGDWIYKKDAVSVNDMHIGEYQAAHNVSASRLCIIRSFAEWEGMHKSNPARYYRLRYSKNAVIECVHCRNVTRSAISGNLVTCSDGYVCTECLPWRNANTASPGGKEMEALRRNRTILVPCMPYQCPPIVVPVTLREALPPVAEVDEEEWE